MKRIELLSFEVYVMTLCEAQKCKSAKDYEDLAEELHGAIESAIQDACWAEGIEDYESRY